MVRQQILHCSLFLREVLAETLTKKPKNSCSSVLLPMWKLGNSLISIFIRWLNLVRPVDYIYGRQVKDSEFSINFWCKRSRVVFQPYFLEILYNLTAFQLLRKCNTNSFPKNSKKNIATWIDFWGCKCNSAESKR